MSLSRPSHDYIPGMCNIGPKERRLRRVAGIVSALATIALLIILLLTDAPTWWRLILILPAASAAIGFLQDALHFCAAFGIKGIYNVVNSPGVVNNIELEESRLKDKRKAVAITLLSGVIGLAVGLLSLLIP